LAITQAKVNKKLLQGLQTPAKGQTKAVPRLSIILALNILAVGELHFVQEGGGNEPP